MFGSIRRFAALGLALVASAAIPLAAEASPARWAYNSGWGWRSGNNKKYVSWQHKKRRRQIAYRSKRINRMRK